MSRRVNLVLSLIIKVNAPFSNQAEEEVTLRAFMPEMLLALKPILIRPHVPPVHIGTVTRSQKDHVISQAVTVLRREGIRPLRISHMRPAI